MSVHVTNQLIQKEWTDYNDHLNMAYYVLIFDKAWEVVLEKFKMGESSAKTTYNSEVKEGDEVEIVLNFFDHDKKRLHFRLEMYEKKTNKLSATIEMLSLYINLNERKVAEFDEERTKIMDSFISTNKANFQIDNLKIKGKLKK